MHPPHLVLTACSLPTSLRFIDVASGDPFDAELPPRVTSISPQQGSLAGGSDLTIAGWGFGSVRSDLSIEVGGIACDVSEITTAGVRCRLQSNPAATAPERPTANVIGSSDSLGSFAGERGVRWQWASSAAGDAGSMLLPSFTVPMDCAAGCSSGWSELGASATTQVVEGWFEAPRTASYMFLLRTDIASTLSWSGNSSATATKTLASASDSDVAAAGGGPAAVEVWNSPVWTCDELPCLDDFASLGAALTTFTRPSVEYSFPSADEAGGVNYGGAFASRWRGSFRAPMTGECVFTLSASSRGYAKLYVDGARVAFASKSTVERSVSLIVNRWHDFELIHHQKASSSSSSRHLEVRLQCPAMEGDAFPSNQLDASPRRRNRALRSWPAWPLRDVDSPFVSSEVSLVANQRCVAAGLDCSPSTPPLDLRLDHTAVLRPRAPMPPQLLVATRMQDG